MALQHIFIQTKMNSCHSYQKIIRCYAKLGNECIIITGHNCQWIRTAISFCFNHLGCNIMPIAIICSAKSQNLRQNTELFMEWIYIHVASASKYASDTHIFGIFVVIKRTGGFTFSHIRECILSAGENISDFHYLFLKHEKKIFKILVLCYLLLCNLLW